MQDQFRKLSPLSFGEGETDEFLSDKNVVDYIHGIEGENS